MVLLKAEHITKKYSGRTIIKDINIELHKGELISLLGVSGSGKTTLFHVLSGLTTPEEGRVLLNGEDITSRPGQISYMLQKDLLFPHKKIIDNTALPLVLHGMSKNEARKKAQMYFKDFGLEETEYQYPSQLSGGMRQRVALARAFTMDSEILLMDEPFSALDKQTSNHLRQELQDIWMKTHKTIFFITHSVEEAVYLGDRVVVMSGEDGGIKNIVPIELDRPRHIYNEDFIAYRHKILEEIQGGDY